ncbi:DUF4189 domain-containing protein [Pseudomonas sp. CGJS7]|uniref:DUF4189 domain-containing protein n=1 Tax=Pseudomonas sp. CGJS7 TaxID=3109348 RepID=UPI003FA74D1B
MNASIILPACALLIVVSGSAAAEGGCPAGMIPYQGTNTMSCGPMPSSGEGSAPSGPSWASRWGAIARDTAAGVMSAVDSRDSKRRARSDAIADCKARGGEKCKVVLTYRNQCVATVYGRTGAEHISARDESSAIQLGMKACTARGDDDCRVYYQACSLPVRIR